MIQADRWLARVALPGSHAALRVLAFTMRTALKKHHTVATTPITWPSGQLRLRHEQGPNELELPRGFKTSSGEAMRSLTAGASRGEESYRPVSMLWHVLYGFPCLQCADVRRCTRRQ